MDAQKLRKRAAAFAGHPCTRKIGIWIVAIVAAIGVLGALVAPLLLRSKLAAVLSDKLHRTVTIEQIRINPYTMTATIRGFLMKERQSAATAVSFDEIYVNLELESLFRLAPVLKELRLVKLYINLVRNENGAYNFTDLIDEFMAGPSGPTPRFSLNNIQIIDGKVDFDDRPEQTKHAISNIKIGVPFISSLQSFVDIKVQAELYALVDNAPLKIGGEAKPFKNTRESNFHFNLENVQLPKYLEYSPVKLNFTMPSGQLNAKLTVGFQSFKDKPAALAISGNLGLKDLVLQQDGNTPLIKLPSFDLVIDSYEVFANRAALTMIKANGTELHLTRDRNGDLNFTSLVSVPPSKTEVPQKKESTPFNYHVDEILIESGKLLFIDQGPEKPYRTQLENIHLNIKGLTNEPEKKANVELSFETDAKERFNHTGSLQLTPLMADGKLEIEGLRPAGFRLYYQSVFVGDIRDGLFDLSTRYSLEQKSDKTELKLTELNAAVRSLNLTEAGQRETMWRLPLLAIKETTVDVNNKAIVIGRIEGQDGSGFVQRNADGSLNYDRLIKSQPKNSPSTVPSKKDDTGWKIEVKQIAVERFNINLEDRAPATPAKINFSDLSIRGENFSNAKNQRGKAIIQTKINNRGLIRLVGTAGAQPTVVRFAVEGRDVDLLPFQSYLENQVNFLLTGGQVGTKGTLTFEARGEGPAKVSYEGNVQITDFAAVETNGSQELLKWKSLNLDGIQFALEPMQLRIKEINLADFYSRLILGADGKMNLQKLTAQNTTDQDALGTKPEQPAEAPVAASPSERRITIGKINLQGGNVNFSDFFIKPNYSANLTGFHGAISELTPETASDIEIHAKLDDAAPVDISGKINPLAKDLYLDIKVNATDIELSPMSPYSGRYVGYGIERGKLTFNVEYKIENRKLSAQNKIILNQLTFGERVESPDATKLPVLLAVALLKDRNGVMDINLPISGSLDDPQFSIGGIVWQIILNILVKAVTSPFALLVSVFSGGSAEELSYVEFDSGRASLNQAAQAKIAALAKAMGDRPSVNLELSGRVDPATDLEGLKRVGIERKVKAQKLKELVRKGETVKSVDEVRIEDSEYPQYLKAAYGEETFPKPRNLIGLARDLPVPEMEKLMMQFAKASDDDMRLLANQRAQAIRDALLATKLVTTDRLFIVAAKPLSAEEAAKIKAKPNRVDFALK
ncbi:MAG: DUF748 domain-containing protein [Deltaproteobacteria bacterium]|nr:DUF748 domain-containing protein [Deltaproteobacteria bacterium]